MMLTSSMQRCTPCMTKCPRQASTLQEMLYWHHSCCWSMLLLHECLLKPAQSSPACACSMALQLLHGTMRALLHTQPAINDAHLRRPYSIMFPCSRFNGSHEGCEQLSGLTGVALGCSRQRSARSRCCQLRSGAGQRSTALALQCQEGQYGLQSRDEKRGARGRLGPTVLAKSSKPR